jgi:hypothetical protein
MTLSGAPSKSPHPIPNTPIISLKLFIKTVLDLLEIADLNNPAETA